MRKVNLTKRENFLTSNLYNKRRNDDIPRFLIIFLEELLIIFNQMLSNGSSGRRDVGTEILHGSSDTLSSINLVFNCMGTDRDRHEIKGLRFDMFWEILTCDP